MQRESEGIRLVNLKSTAFGAAVERLVMSVWLCPYHRTSLPMQSIENLGMSTSRYTMIEIAIRGELRVLPNAAEKFYDGTRMAEAFSARKWKKEREIWSGITVKQLFRIILDDEQFVRKADIGTFLAVLHALDTEYNKSTSSKKAPWNFFTFQDRIDLLDFSHSQNFVDKYVILSSSERVSALEYWRSAVIGFSAKTVFQVYEALNDPTRNGQARPETIRYIQEKREEFLGVCRPLVHAYLNVIEPIYLRRQARSKEPALPFPDELVDHVAAFLSKSRFSKYDIPDLLM